MVSLLAAMCEQGCTIGDGIAIFGLSIGGAVAAVALFKYGF